MTNNYALKDVTPKPYRCGIGSCPAVFERGNDYFIVGQRAEPSEFGLDDKVGQLEALVRVPKSLLSDIADKAR